MSAEPKGAGHESRAASFLQMIRRSERGRLKVYLGYCPGVGKTCRMLEEGRRLLSEGIDVVAGLVETHGRAGTAALLEGLPVHPPRTVKYKGIRLAEMDLPGLLQRRPQVVLVDELAHTNAPGSANGKRWEDVEELLSAGIHVVTTVNVQHLESLAEAMASVVGSKVRERVPDSVVAEADQVVNVDLSEEDLLQRLREGNIYPPERVGQALEGFFQFAKLERLREIALRELASRLDRRRRESEEGPGGQALPSGGAVAVALRGGSDADLRLLRQGSRLAGRLARDWFAVHVDDGREPDFASRRLLEDAMALAQRLGASVLVLRGDDLAEALTAFADQYGVSHLVLGSPRPRPWWRRLGSGLLERLQRGDPRLTLEVCGREPMTETVHNPAPDAFAELSSLIRPDAIRAWDDPVGRDALLSSLVATCLPDSDELDRWKVLDLVLQREQKGSTFLAEGVALPHARVEGLDAPRAALAVTRSGVLGTPMGESTEVVLLLLAPASDPSGHLRRMAAAARILRDRDVRRRLLRAGRGEAGR